MRFFQKSLKLSLLQKPKKIFQFLKFFHQIFFTKYERNVDMKNVQKHDFCLKIDQIMSMSNMPK
jgi:hypothetical protein